MSVPSMVHRSGDALIVRSVVSGDPLFGTSSADDFGVDEELTEIVEDSRDLPECKIKRNYSCPSCDYFTQNPRNFLYHLRDEHKEKVKIYECPNCLYASKHYQKLLRHAKMVHGSADGVEMPRGKKRAAPTDDSEDRDSEEEEEEVVEKNNPLNCSQCPFTARNQNQLGKHERDEHTKTKNFKCSKCTYTTPIKARFTKHTKYHSMPMIKCDLCDFKTPYKWNLDRHCKNHNGTGIFRCSACNFTADIKQSLTVHEMNHHVPPVGQATGIGVGRRRNKVGASDTTAAEDATQVAPSESLASEPSAVETAKKPKVQPSKKSTKNSNAEQRQANAYGSDFINPNDIIHHANGQIYIKNKCKLCNYKSAWDGEMAKHEEKVHNIVRNINNNNNNSSNNNAVAKPIKKTSKPLPNLIPIPTQISKIVPQQFCQPVLNMSSPPIQTEPTYSQKDINDICAKSVNSELKDFASLIDSEDVLKAVHNEPANIPDLIPTASFSKQSKSASFFDKKFRAKLTTDNLHCGLCGHESKCLTEFESHKKSCGRERIHVPSAIPIHTISSTRCQFCRQRCKSSSDLVNHLQTCPEALKSFTESVKEVRLAEEDEDNKDREEEPHPMENRVFVWNNIQVPMDIEVDTNDDVQYEYVGDKQDDNISLDLSVRTQSPNSENSFVGIEHSTPTPTPTITEKIPTHGNDITIAQHKRVFKCPHCTFWASTASRFHVHIVGHLNKKPFECSLCSYRSNWRWDITKHIKLKSVRDPAHETAKVLMTDETGRRNYTKYNKYLTEINVSADHNETSGGSGTRPRNHQESPSQVALPSKTTDLPRVGRAPNSNDFSPLLRSPRPVPELKAADKAYFAAKIAGEKKRSNAENKKTLWQCKKCNFRDPSREKLLSHVRSHYQQSSNTNGGETTVPVKEEIDEASAGGGYSRGQAPFRCGHCQQVSNWKHVIQRHCRLKHSGDIRVVMGSKNGPEKMEVDDQMEEHDLMDLPQTGVYKCAQCPFSSNDAEDLERHSEGHLPKDSTIVTRCTLCNFNTVNRMELLEHLKLHGVPNPEEYLLKQDRMHGDGEITKRYQCTDCPYDTNSKSQFSYHKQFHKSKGYQYTCSTCGYNVSRRHLLHQHMKVHGINKQNGDGLDLEEISDEIEEVPQGSSSSTSDLTHLSDIPLVWVSKNGKFSKMHKCRYCPHVNSRKVNIQDHERMHGIREKNPNSSRLNEIEHRCPDCNYVCNNAGVLSSHSKVHQGLYGRIHGLVDVKRSDEEQIREMSQFLGVQGQSATTDTSELDDDDNIGDLVIDDDVAELTESLLYFCDKCPARFLKENEFQIHLQFHSERLTYKCDYCSYTARQQAHILAHNNVHSEEYQKRTEIFKTMYNSHPEYPQPRVLTMETENGSINVVNEVLEVIKPSRTNFVPLSGTDLFQQRNEAQLKQRSSNLLRETVVNNNTTKTDPQFGTQMHGNPDFVYPTCVKNGKMKEKRYKCHKCPSAFEKRDQYKIHLGLHGAKNKFNCEYCDYSVKYYANYTQHIKKHQVSADAIAKRSPNSSSEDVVDESAESVEKPEEAEVNLEEKELHVCSYCPYTNHRRDAVDEHMKKHTSISGNVKMYTCEHCDYSVPQLRFLRDHTKLHFAAPKATPPDGYLICDNIKITSKAVDDDAGEERLVFEHRGPKEDRFEPVLGGDGDVAPETLNNNMGERMFVNPDTGEFVVGKEASSTSQTSAVDLSVVATTDDDNLDSQGSSDN